VPLSDTARDLQSMINDVAVRVPDIMAVALASSDGLLVAASDAVDRDQGDELAAVACGLVSIVSGTTARMFAGDPVDYALAKLKERLLMVRPIADGSVLAVIAGASSDIATVDAKSAELSAWISQVLTPELRAELQQSQPF
jgi:predicted regulator of Ras-like GTPase activity (Roadblock/LC7/MglB family)